jgi:hypothetical protein
MSARAAWGIVAVSLACAAASAALWVADRYGLRHLVADGAHVDQVLIAVTFSAVGALIVSRRPGHRVGWIFCAGGLLSAVNELATSYAVHAYRSQPVLPGGRLAATLGSVGWVPAFGLIVFLLLRFPDGRPLSRRWVVADRLAAAGIALATVGVALYPHAVLPQEGLRIDNPAAIPAAKAEFALMVAAGGALIVGTMVAGVVALVLRWRRSSGPERLQLKWFTYAAAVTAVVVLGTIELPAGLVIGTLQAVIVGPALAVATGTAILRHRLYDIDVVINRTLVYGALTATLAGTYLALVLLVGLAVGHSGFAVAISTLAVAALFRPARARIQAGVDRRFYRRRYDAQRTLDAFGARLRDEVELESVGAHLRAAVRDTVQPAHMTLWLPTERRTT